VEFSFDCTAVYKISTDIPHCAVGPSAIAELLVIYIMAVKKHLIVPF